MAEHLRRMEDPVPSVLSIDVIYPQDAVSTQTERWTRLLNNFQERYQHPAEFVARSPGRVNIIGEHIDYSLYEVLPMAVTADVLVAVSTTTSHSRPSRGHGSTVSISNVNSSKYPPSEFRILPNGDVYINASTHDWTNYFKAGARGAMGLLLKLWEGIDSFLPENMEVMIDGNVPSGGGLSSSAAFVCASALAVLKANGETKFSKKDLVELAIVSERAVGVNSGGMDQAASVFSIRGTALSVSFFPTLEAKTIGFPQTDPGLTFVIAQSFVAADKHVTAPECYNLRVVECTLAAAVLAKLTECTLQEDSGPLGISLRGFQDAYTKKLNVPLDEDHGANPSTFTELSDSMIMCELQLMTDLIHRNLDEEGYTREHIASILETSTTELEERYMSKFPVRAEKFKLKQRAQHVFEEALRVLQFRTLLKARDSETLLTDLGNLMNETQESCRTLYECSCPELDELCNIARHYGAYGSRLTGAGWGGCTVHLVPKDKVDGLKEAWKKEYYSLKFADLTEEQLNDKLNEAIVVSAPGSGAMLYDITISYSQRYPLQVLTNLPGTKKLLDPKKPSIRNRDGHSSNVSTIDLERAGLGPPPPPAHIRQHLHDHLRAADEFRTVTRRRRAEEYWRFQLRGESADYLSMNDEGLVFWVEDPSEDGYWPPESDASGSIIPRRSPPPPTVATSRTALWVHRRRADVASIPDRWVEEWRPALAAAGRRLIPATTWTLRDGWPWWRDTMVRPFAEGWEGRWNVEIGTFVAEMTAHAVEETIGVCMGVCGCCFGCFAGAVASG
ncbi:galactokinase [Acarospora aff. strigata]|nr:galactokinase [Acarospora aff. strigata]